MWRVAPFYPIISLNNLSFLALKGSNLTFTHFIRHCPNENLEQLHYYVVSCPALANHYLLLNLIILRSRFFFALALKNSSTRSLSLSRVRSGQGGCNGQGTICGRQMIGGVHKTVRWGFGLRLEGKTTMKWVDKVRKDALHLGIWGWEASALERLGKGSIRTLSSVVLENRFLLRGEERRKSRVKNHPTI